MPAFGQQIVMGSGHVEASFVPASTGWCPRQVQATAAADAEE
jgi:hypothetical protein